MCSGLGTALYTFVVSIQQNLQYSVVECLTRDREAVGLNLTGITVLCP